MQFKDNAFTDISLHVRSGQKMQFAHFSPLLQIYCGFGRPNVSKRLVCDGWSSITTEYRTTGSRAHSPKWSPEWMCDIRYISLLINMISCRGAVACPRCRQYWLKPDILGTVRYWIGHASWQSGEAHIFHLVQASPKCYLGLCVAVTLIRFDWCCGCTQVND